MGHLAEARRLYGSDFCCSSSPFCPACPPLQSSETWGLRTCLQKPDEQGRGYVDMNSFSKLAHTHTDHTFEAVINLDLLLCSRNPLKPGICVHGCESLVGHHLPSRPLTFFTHVAAICRRPCLRHWPAVMRA